MTDLVLSLFPGIGLLDMAFEEEGFCVVRGPDLLWGGDIHHFHPPACKFDGVIGGPPCQQFSRFAEMARRRGHKLAENLIPEYERCVKEAAPAWFLMENVPDAPEPAIDDYGVISFLLNNRWVGGEQNRLRRFSFGVRGSVRALAAYLDYEIFEPVLWAPTICARGEPYNRKTKDGTWKVSNTGATARTVANGLRLQGLPADFFEHSPLTIEGKQKMIGNGVPLPMGRAIAKAVRAALAAMQQEKAAWPTSRDGTPLYFSPQPSASWVSLHNAQLAEHIADAHNAQLAALIAECEQWHATIAALNRALAGQAEDAEDAEGGK